MFESKLRSQSMDFAVQIINLVKALKEKRESIISNQIGRSTFVRHSMLTVRQTLLPSFKQHLKKQMRQDIGWNFYIRKIT